MSQDDPIFEKNSNSRDWTEVVKATLGGLSLGTVVGSLFGPSGTVVGALIAGGAGTLIGLDTVNKPSSKTSQESETSSQSIKKSE